MGAFTFLFACSSSDIKSDTALTQDDSTAVPACLVAGSDQTQLWERHGTPNSLTVTNQVAPSLVVYQDELWIFYSQREGLKDSIALIRSSDGETWSAPETITDLDSFSDIMNINVTVQDGTFIAMIGGGRIGQAISSDGRSWEVTGTQIIPTGDFDSYGQLYPSLSANGEQLWYTGFDGQAYAIGHAALIYGVWSNEEKVMEADSSSPFENRAVGQLSIFEDDTGYVAWYGGYDTSQTDPGPWRILTARSDDGFNWSERTLALDLQSEGEEAWSVREPSVVQRNDTLWMAYIGMGDDGEYRLRMASCGPE